MLHPKAIVTVNGAPVAGLFWERLVRLSITDHAGGKADTLDLVLEDGQPHNAIPKHGDVVSVALGYEETGVEHMGLFKVTDVDLDLFPFYMKVKGESADLREKLKQHRTKHYDDKTYGDIFNEIAGRHGLSAQVAPSIAAAAEKWVGQQGESDLHFGERLARRANGLFSIKDNRLIVAERGSGMGVGGLALPALIITPPMIKRDSASVSFGKREKHKDAKASYYDKGKAKRETVQEQSDSSGSASYSLRHPYGSKAEAKRAAKAKASYLKGDGIRTSVSIEGNPLAKAGVPMSYAGVRPGVDGLVFTVETARHDYSKGPGYLTTLNAKIKNGSGDGAGDGD